MWEARRFAICTQINGPFVFHWFAQGIVILSRKTIVKSECRNGTSVSPPPFKHRSHSYIIRETMTKPGWFLPQGVILGACRTRVWGRRCLKGLCASTIAKHPHRTNHRPNLCGNYFFLISHLEWETYSSRLYWWVQLITFPLLSLFIHGNLSYSRLSLKPTLPRMLWD